MKTQTMIRIEIEVVNELKKLGKYGDSYSDIIRRLIDEHIKNRQKTSDH